MDPREEFIRERAAFRERQFVDFASSTEFAELPEDYQEGLAEDAPEWDGPSVAPAPHSRGEAWGMMFARGSIFSASNAVADARNFGRDTNERLEGGWRGPISNFMLREEREDYTPTDEEVVAAASRYGLGPETYEKLVDWSASPADLQRVAEGLASLQLRDTSIQEAVGPVDGFLMDFAANALQPEFLVLGAGAGKLLQGGVALSRTGAALRGAGAAAVVDAPLEAYRAHENPYYSYTDAAVATVLSAGLGAGAGLLGNGLLKPQDIVDMQRVDEVVADSLRHGSPNELVLGGGGAMNYNRLVTDPLEIGSEGFDAPERVFTFGWTPAGTVWNSEDPLARTLIDDLTLNPHRSGQGETLFEISDRVTASGGFFLQEADAAMRGFWRNNATTAEVGAVEQVTAGWTQQTGGVTDAQATKFYEEVGQVIAGVRTTDDPAVRQAAEALRDGFEDSLYYMQDSNYVGWTSGPRREPTGTAIPEAADIEVDRFYLPRVPSAAGFEEVRRTFLPSGSSRARRSNPENLQVAHNRMGDRIGEILLRSDSNREWFETLAERWNAGRKNTPNAAGIVADPMTAAMMARRIGRQYIETWRMLSQRAVGDAQSGTPQRSMSVQDRDAVKEIVEEIFQDGSELNAELRDEVMETVLNLVAPARRRTTADSPRLMDRMDLRLDAEADRDILGMFEWDASRLFKDYRRHVAGRAALLRKGYDGPAAFETKANDIVRRAEGRGQRAVAQAEKEKNLLLQGLGAITGDSRYMDDMPVWQRKAKFVTQGIARMNVAAYLSNTALGPMFAEYGGLLFSAQHRLLTRLPAYRNYIKAARAGDREAMKGGFMIADVLAGHGSSLVRARGTAKNRFDDALDEVDAPEGRLAGAYDEFTRKAANATGRFSGMTMANDALRSISMLTDIENWAKGRVTTFQLRQAGVSESMWPRIQRLLANRPMTKGAESGEAILDDAAFMQMAADTDPEAFNALIGALNRRARRVVQDPDWGHAPQWSKLPGLDLIFQFFSYPINAVNKQVVPFGRAIGARDPQALQTLFQAMFAGLGYVNRVYLQSLTKSDPAEYRESRLRAAEIGKAMFYYSTVSSVAPNLWDGAMDVAGNVAPDAVADAEDFLGASLRFSSTRASGLSATPWTGNPTYSRIDSILRSSSRLIRGEDLEGNSERLAASIVPLGNSIPATVLFNTIFEPLPGDDDEDD